MLVCKYAYITQMYTHSLAHHAFNDRVHHCQRILGFKSQGRLIYKKRLAVEPSSQAISGKCRRECHDMRNIYMLILTHIHACDHTPHAHYHGIGARNMQTCNAQITCVVFNVGGPHRMVAVTSSKTNA